MAKDGSSNNIRILCTGTFELCGADGNVLQWLQPKDLLLLKH